MKRSRIVWLSMVVFVEAFCPTCCWKGTSVLHWTGISAMVLVDNFVIACSVGVWLNDFCT